MLSPYVPIDTTTLQLSITPIIVHPIDVVIINFFILMFILIFNDVKSLLAKI